MAAREQWAAMGVVRDLLAHQTGHLGRTTFVPQKGIPAEPGPETAWFPRTEPEQEGISSEYLGQLLRELIRQPGTDLHHLMILRHGRVILECSVPPYRPEIWHASYSLCKSITGMAVGMLVGEGRLSLDEEIHEIFREKRRPHARRRMRPVTVRHLLTMTSQVQFGETGAVAGDDWIGSFLRAPVKGIPGKEFSYNSMNSYMLSAIVTRRTGVSMADYLRPRLFDPLAIRDVFWESCPAGITKGGWGLFLRPEDAAKLGQLYLQKGRWAGRQLIPASWVRESASRQAVPPAQMGPFGYGYQLWLEERPGSFAFNGMLGQNVIVYPDLDMVLVTNAGSGELFQNCVMLDTIRRYFPHSFHPPALLPPDPAAACTLRTLCRTPSAPSLFAPPVRRTLSPADSAAPFPGSRPSAGSGITQHSIPPRRPAFSHGRAVFSHPHGGWPLPRRHDWSRPRSSAPSALSCAARLAGRAYEPEETYAGLLPLLLQVCHNNFTSGIRRLAFTLRQGRFFLHLTEGDDVHHIAIGLYTPMRTLVRVNGEPYLLAASGAFAYSDEGALTLSLDIAFLEEAARRLLTIRILPDRLLLGWDETPGQSLLLEALQTLLPAFPTARLALRQQTAAVLRPVIPARPLPEPPPTSSP